MGGLRCDGACMAAKRPFGIDARAPGLTHPLMARGGQPRSPETRTNSGSSRDGTPLHARRVVARGSSSLSGTDSKNPQPSARRHASPVCATRAIVRCQRMSLGGMAQWRAVW